MKAVICTQYGEPEVLHIVDMPKPTINDEQVLVKVMSTAVNSADSRVRGLKVDGFLRIVMRLVLGIRKPRNPILGVVLSGIVEEVGSKVVEFKKGDEIYAMTGFRFGAYAEYISLNQSAVIGLKPTNASFDEAAAIVFGGTTSLYFLHKAGIESKSQPNVLIYGATGAVGTSAVQIAKSYGAHITAVCSQEGADLVHSLGADEVIIYTEQDFTKLNTQFDIIFYAVGKTTKAQCQHLLAPEGKYKTVGGLETASETKEQLHILKSLFEKGNYQAVIDKVYSIDDIVAAHHYVDEGKKKGNVVIRVAE